MIRIGFEPLSLQKLYRDTTSSASGALVVFDGRVRDHSAGKSVLYLEYEAHESMAVREMNTIRQEAMHRWPLDKAVIFHRLGRIEIGESSVLIGIAATHRSDAFSACRYIIDELQKRVPIWKKEFFSGGAVWVDGTFSTP